MLVTLLETIPYSDLIHFKPLNEHPYVNGIDEQASSKKIVNEGVKHFALLST